MTTLPIDEVATQLAELIRKLAPGEEIILVDGGMPIAKITAVSSLSTESDPTDAEKPLREYAQYT